MIRFDQFGGIAPKIADHLLPQHMATQANNCRFGSGAIEPWHVPSHIAYLLKAGTKKSIYRYADQFWFHWIEDVNIVQAPVAADAYGRVYWTGEGYPKVGGSDVVTSGGGGSYPSASYRMGVPAPASAPYASVSGEPTDTIAAVERFYVFTYVNQYGAEGPPSDPSGEVLVANGQTPTVTLPGGAPVGNYNIVSKNLYRTEKGSSSTEWLLVASGIPVAQTSFVDNVSADTLTKLLPSLDWDGPPDDMAGLIDHPMGSLAGFSGKELLLSVPFRPHAWPYRYAVSDPIVAIGVFGTGILVATTGKPYLFVGNDPAAMSPERLEKGEACVSKRGFVDMGTSCIFPGPSGLWGAGLNDISLLTDRIMQLEDWRAYKPESLLGASYDGNYVGFYDNGTTQGGFVFDPATGDFSPIDTFATGAWTDPKTRRLYLVVDGDLVEWNGGSTFYSVSWESKKVRLASPTNFCFGRVIAGSYPVTLQVYADGTLKHTQTVTGRSAFRLPGGFTAQDWQCKVTGAAKIEQIALANSIEEMKQA